MYIGPVVPSLEPLWVSSQETKKFENIEMNYYPGLYKLFDVSYLSQFKRN